MGRGAVELVAVAEGEGEVEKVGKAEALGLELPWSTWDPAWVGVE